jgi:hypothetical protein
MFHRLKGKIWPFIFERENGDGILNYLLLWSDVNLLVDQINNCPEIFDEPENALCFAVAHA